MIGETHVIKQHLLNLNYIIYGVQGTRCSFQLTNQFPVLLGLVLAPLPNQSVIFPDWIPPLYVGGPSSAPSGLLLHMCPAEEFLLLFLVLSRLIPAKDW